MNSKDQSTPPPPKPDRAGMLAWLLFLGVIVYCNLPDNTVSSFSTADQGSRLDLELRTGGFDIQGFWRWSPPGDPDYPDHGAPVFGFILAYRIRTGVPPWYNEFIIGLPWWFVVALAAAPSLDRLAKRMAERKALREQRLSGLCAVCGYDLRATPDRCPECGTFRVR